MVKTFINGQQVEIQGNMRSSHDVLEEAKKIASLEEENKWLISIIKKISDFSYDNDLARAAMAGIAMPEHIQKKLGWMTSEEIDKTVKEKEAQNKSSIRK